MFVLGIALGIDFLVDDKLILAGIAVVWIGACSISLRRIRNARARPAE
jgi:hypothetical protein